MVGAAIIGGAVVGAGASYYGSKKAGEEAADASEYATDTSVAEQRRQFDALVKLMTPYTDAGQRSLTAQQTMLGLNGAKAEEAMIKQLESSPEMKAMIKQGETAILQNASATGGLRGGNTQAALAEFRPAVLSQIINDRFAKLGAISQLGQASAAGTGSAAIDTGRGISAALLQHGQIAGQAAGAPYLAGAQGISNIADSVGTYAMLKNLKAF